MPVVTRWFIRSGFLSLLLALTLRTIGAFNLGPPAPLLALARPTVLHLLVVGWLTQLIFGVAYWMFPRHPTHPPRGPEPLVWTAFVLLNLGLILRVFVEPLAPTPGTRVFLVASAVLHLVAVILFTTAIWPRIRAR